MLCPQPTKHGSAKGFFELDPSMRCVRYPPGTAIGPQRALHMQVKFSILERKPLNTGLLQACQDLGVTLVAHSPLDQGKLTGMLHSASCAFPYPSDSKEDYVGFFGSLFDIRASLT